jgi:hypothetical protein
MYKMMVKTGVVFWSETGAVTEMDMKRLGTWERKILRKIYGAVVEQGIWRVITDQDLREICKYLDIVADIKKKRFEWIGHVAKMNQGSPVKKAFEFKPEGGRRKGSSRLRWLEDVKKYLR